MGMYTLVYMPSCTPWGTPTLYTRCRTRYHGNTGGIRVAALTRGVTELFIADGRVTVRASPVSLLVVVAERSNEAQRGLFLPKM